ncbi:Site-specific recombinase XerD [Desulfotomaculum arcticum]|uniref:Site-specific recombinase XerD n=1 Tax=Desulfotruncus arcticus DSM 17038 TaxID=1121424 RepID=A0A1I2N3R4_9FIRM|nr:site-specific integrase [Desulfotruncus arcticus]SFF97750.1 Site-specific recombinase XerD [Desulfotomaculum arcticum] [Desulfotruncus arcticus DSM 17038]
MAQIRRRGPNKYAIIIYLGRDDTGKKLCHSETFYGSRPQAKLRADELELSLKKKYTGSKAGKMTLGEYLDQWLIVTKETYDEGTWAKNAWHVRRLKECVGDFSLHKLSIPEVQQALQGLNNSPRTKRDFFDTLRTAVRQAVVWGLLSNNPLEGLRRPKVPRKEAIVLGRKELYQLLEAAKGYRHYLVIRLLAVSGIRLGEVLGLKWEDVDFDKSTFKIQRSANCRKRILKDEPKNFSSRRTIQLDDETLKELARHKQVERCTNPDNLVFPALDGRPMKESAVRKTMNRALKKAGLEHIKLHGLRHTAGSIKLDAGEGLATVSAFLGHSSTATTAAIYAHAIRGGVSIANYLESDSLSD